jgi:hypothetical protein
VPTNNYQRARIGSACYEHGIADEPERIKYSAIASPTQVALPEMIRQSPMGLFSSAQVQPRLVALPDLMLFRMPQIAIRPKIPNIVAVKAGGTTDVQFCPRISAQAD